MQLKVLFAASECAPIAKVGGLADVIGSLPKALAELGVDVRIALPKYGFIDANKYQLELVASDIAVGQEKVNVWQMLLPESNVIIYLLENEKFFSGKHVYFEHTAFVGSFKEIERFLFFSMAVAEIFTKINWFADILHCHDWHTAILPALVKLQPATPNPKPKTMLTIHNLANQGKWNAGSILNFLGIVGDETEGLKLRDKEGDLNIFEQGILNADIINTVSPTYKKEILKKEYGAGLEKSLFKKNEDLYGILNGIDTEIFDPKTDSSIKANYSFANIETKRENKLDLQDILNLRRDESVPLLGLISRLTDQKGIDLLVQIIPNLVKAKTQIVVLGMGHPKLEQKLAGLSLKYPKNVSVHIEFDVSLAQKIYAGCDIFLMPSQFEPCGLGQMIAMRYGTIPVVRKTGGLADTVLDKKTGFVFESYDAKKFLAAVMVALNSYKDKSAWQLMIKRAMAQDFSWKSAAKEYLRLYKKLTKRVCPVE